MSLTGPVNLQSKNPGRLRELAVAAGFVIYKGAIVTIRTTTGAYIGYAAPAGGGFTFEQFAGIAAETIDNTLGANGDATIEVWTSGRFLLPIQSSAYTPALLLYAADDASLTHSGLALVGRMTNRFNSTHAWVELTGPRDQ